MNGRMRRVGRHVEALLGDRRPPRGALDPEDVGALVAAIEMVSARPQAGLPRPRFVEGLAARLREQARGDLRHG